jgi:predicted transcriptional regulator
MTPHARVDFEKICNLYFELSNEERLEILYLLAEEPRTLTGLSNELSIRNQQCSRHLSRLAENGLITKYVDGNQILTELGAVILSLQPTMQFLTDHHDYSISHRLLGIPPRSLYSLGMIRNGSVTGNLNLSLFTIERIIREAEESLHEVTGQFQLNTIQPRNEALKRKVALTSIEPYDMVMPGEIRDWFRSNPEYVDVAHESRTEGLIKERVVPRVNYMLHMSEKEAFVTFSLLDGSYDYAGFASKDEEFLSWCQSLFQETWIGALDKGAKIKELYTQVARDEELSGSLMNFPKSGTSSLESLDIVKANELTVMGEIVRQFLDQSIPPSAIDDSQYWKSMRR